MASQVWKHFKIDVNDNKFARCNFCDKLVSRGGSSKTTSNLLKHLKTHSKNLGSSVNTTNRPSNSRPTSQVIKSSRETNPSVPGTSTSSNLLTFFKPATVTRPTLISSVGQSDSTEYDDPVPDNPAWLGVNVSDDSISVETVERPNSATDQPLSALSPISGTSSGKLSLVSPSSLDCFETQGQGRPTLSLYPKVIKCRNKKQITLEGAFDRISKFAANDERSTAITKLIVEMICIDMQPFSIVENKGFLRLLKHLEPRYTVPSRKSFSNKILFDMYNKLVDEVEEELKEAKFVAVTTDMWTSEAQADFMAVTAHFYKEESNSLILIHRCLDVIPFPEISHTGDNILKFLDKVFEEWGIREKVVGVVRDNGPDITAALNRSNYEAFVCVAHTLQLVIKDGVLDNLKVTNLLKKSRKLVGCFKHSSKATKVLKNVQMQHGLPAHRMIQDEPTQWNSSFYMLKRLLEQKDAIVLLSNKPDVSLSVEMTPDDWRTMSFAVQLLEIFETATLQLSKESSTISEIIPLIHTVSSVIESQDVTGSGLMGLKNDIIASIKMMYPSVESNLALACSTLLDPRFKQIPFKDNDMMERAKAKIVLEMDEGEECTNVNVNPPVVDCESSNNSAKKQGFWAHYSEIFKLPSTSASEQSEVGCQEELEQYLKERTLDPKKADKLGSYWFSSPHSRLKNLALKYLCVPPSTVFSERLFSTAGAICDQKRNRLDPERIKMLVFLNKNIK